MLKRLLKYVLIVAATLVIGLFIQSSGNFPDPDSFYHAGMVDLIREKGIVAEFPWLQFTELKTRFVDHHLLYHLALLPLLKFFDPLDVVRVGSIVFAGLAVLTFFFIQENKRIKTAFFSTLILLVSSSFIFRINLGKGVAPVIALFLLILWCVFERKIILLFFLSALYPWLYAGWPVVLLLPTAEALAAGALAIGGVTGSRVKVFLLAVLERGRLKTASAAILGIVFGVVSNPYFPNNLWFTWIQAVKIGLVNYQGKISVGQEWYPIEYGELFGNIALALVFVIVSFSILFLSVKKSAVQADDFINKRSRETLTLAILSGIFFLLTIKSRRSAEYFIPLFLLTSSWSADMALRIYPNILRELRQIFLASSARIVFVSYLVLVSIFIASRDLLMVKRYFEKGFSVTAYLGASRVIKENSAPGEVVFHSDWDEFPILFYHDRERYYLAGLDPTFFYDYDQSSYERWREVVTGKYKGDLYKLITESFNSKIIFVDAEHKKFKTTLQENKMFTLVYEDEEASVFKAR